MVVVDLLSSFVTNQGTQGATAEHAGDHETGRRRGLRHRPKRFIRGTTLHDLPLQEKLVLTPAVMMRRAGFGYEYTYSADPIREEKW